MMQNLPVCIQTFYRLHREACRCKSSTLRYCTRFFY